MTMLPGAPINCAHIKVVDREPILKNALFQHTKCLQNFLLVTMNQATVTDGETS